MAFEEVGVRAVIKNQKGFEDGMDRINKKVGTLGSKLKTALKLGAVAGAAALAGAGFAAVKMASQFETAFTEVTTLFDLPEKQINELRQGVLDLSAEMGIDAVETTKALYQAISAGVEPAKALAFIEKNARLAIGGVTDLETAVDLTTTVLNAFGLQEEELGRVSDVLFTGVRLGKTTVAELGASMFNIAPIAAAAGVSIEEVTAATAALTAGGTPTSVATTSMRQAIAELGKEGTKANKVFEEIAGVGFRKFIEEGGDLVGAMEQLRLKAEEDGVAVSDLFGSIEAGTAAQVLAGEGAEAFAAALSEMQDAAGATDIAFNKMNKTFGRQVAILKSKLKKALTEVGLKILPVLTKLVAKLNKVFEKGGKSLGKFGETFKEVGDVVKDFVTAISSNVWEDWSQALFRLPTPLGEIALFIRRVATAAGQLLPVLFGLVRAVASDVFADFAAVMKVLLNLVVIPMIRQLGKLVSAYGLFAEKVGGSEKSMTAIKDVLVLFLEAWLAILAAKKIVSFTQRMVRTGAAFITGVRDVAQTITQRVVRTGAAFIRITQKVVEQTIKQTVKVSTPPKELLKKLGVEVGVGMARGLGTALVAAAVAAAFVAGVPAAIIAAVIAAIIAIPLAAFLFWKFGGVELAKSLISGVVEFIKQAVPFVAGAIVGLHFAAVAIVVPFVAKKGAQLGLALMKAWGDVLDKSGPLLVKGLSIALAAVLAATTEFITRTLPTEIKAGLPNVRKGFGEGLKAAFVDLPVLWFTVVIPGTVKFFTSTMPNAIVDAIVSAAEFVIGAFTGVGADIIGGLLAGIGDVFEQVKGPFEEGFNEAIDFVKGLLGIRSASTVFEQIGKDIMLGLLNGITSIWTELVLPFFKGLPGRIVNAVLTNIPGAGLAGGIGGGIGDLLPDVTPGFSLPVIGQRGIFDLPRNMLIAAHAHEMLVPAGPAEVLRQSLMASPPSTAVSVPINLSLQTLDWAEVTRVVLREVDIALKLARAESIRAGEPLGSGIG